MLNASNFRRAYIVEFGRMHSIFGRVSGNRHQRRAAMAKKRMEYTNTGYLDKINADLEALTDEFGGLIIQVHPTRGYRSMSSRRLTAQVVMAAEFGVVQ